MRKFKISKNRQIVFHVLFVGGTGKRQDTNLLGKAEDDLNRISPYPFAQQIGILPLTGTTNEQPN